jgi:hypothetical protein
MDSQRVAVLVAASVYYYENWNNRNPGFLYVISLVYKSEFVKQVLKFT